MVTPLFPCLPGQHRGHRAFAPNSQRRRQPPFRCRSCTREPSFQIAIGGGDVRIEVRDPAHAGKRTATFLLAGEQSFRIIVLEREYPNSCPLQPAFFPAPLMGNRAASLVLTRDSHVSPLATQFEASPTSHSGHRWTSSCSPVRRG